MTQEEYKEKVGPILKEFKKFIRRNSKYFVKADYYGILYLTYPEYIEQQKQRLLRGGFENLITDEYMEKSWMEKSAKKGEKTTEKVPEEIYSEYKVHIEVLTELFGEENMSKVQDDEGSKNKRSVRRALDDDTYLNALIDGEISTQKLDEIFNSVGLKMPKRLIEMKHKVEHEGYSRNVADKTAERNQEFATKITAILKDEDVVKKLKDKKRGSVLSLVEQFESSDSDDIYDFARNISKSNPEAYDTLIKLFKKEGHGAPYTRISKFYEEVEKICEEYVDTVIERFIYRSNKKLAIVNKNLGLPDIKMGEFNTTRDIEGYVDLVWPNGLELKMHSRIILAGGTYLQVLHERYLFTFYKDGKKIELEQMDKIQ